MTNIQIITGTWEAPGGYSVDGVAYLGEREEALVDEAREMAQATGRRVEDVLALIIPKQ